MSSKKENRNVNTNKPNSQMDKGSKPKSRAKGPKEKVSRTVPVQQNGSKRPKAQRPKKKNVLSRVHQLHKLLNELRDMKVPLGNDKFIVESISGHRENVYSFWKPSSVRWYRTITNLKKKLEYPGMVVKTSDSELTKKFLDTQVEPITSTSVISRLANTFRNYFDGFDYDEVERLLKSQHRTLLVTNGVNFPNNLAPAMTGEDSNAELIAGMKLGRDIFLPSTDLSSVFTGIAAGKFTFVPKNDESKRGITIARAELIDFQDVIAAKIKDWCTVRSRTDNHITQFDDQTVQHRTLEALGFCSIDLSSASDRVYKTVLKKVWPEFYERFSHLLPDDVLMPDGRVIPLLSVGTQGFPLTFVLMSVLTGLLVKTVKLSHYVSTNYGDDIIVHESDFGEVVCALESIGLKVNHKKTHKSSDGFVESCGYELMFTRFGTVDVVTPIYLRGIQDVNFIEYFNQLIGEEMIEPEDATRILSKLGVDFFAYDYDYPVSEFHVNYGPHVNVPIPKDFNKDMGRYELKIPFIHQEIDCIRGLDSKNSDIVLELLDINSKMKDSSVNETFIRGSAITPRQHRLDDLKSSKWFTLYKALSQAKGHDAIGYDLLSKNFLVDIKVVFYYVFITSEMRKYRYSSPTVDFSDYTVKDFDLKDLLDQIHGMKPKIQYPIFRYKSSKKYKFVEHPLGVIHLDV